jgi:hypothetical protein
MTHLWRFVMFTAVVACSAPRLQPAGGGCLLTTDCQDGLVCVKQRCSSDLSGIVKAAQPVPRVLPEGGDSGDEANGAADSAGAGDDASDGPADDTTQDVAALE